MTVTTSTTDRQAIAWELFLLGYRNLHTNVLGQVALALLVAAGTWYSATHVRVLVWLTGMMAVALAMATLIWVFRQGARSSAQAQTVQQWQWASRLVTSVAGVAWGCLGQLFVPGAEVNNLLAMTSFAGAVAYSSVTNVHDIRGYYYSVGIATAILIYHVPVAYGAQAWQVIGMCLLYMVVLGQVARNAHKMLIESVRLRLDNERLAQTNAAHANRAEKANRDKSEFLAAASHDLRQPVHALMLLIEAYRQSNPVAAKHPLIQQIAAAGQSVSALFNALMELSRLDSGTERLTPEPLHAAALLASVLEPMRPQADRKGLRLRLRIARSLQQVVIHSDKVLLERVLGNLLSNAVRYTARGGVLLSLRPAHGATGLWLEVWDSGVGIAPEDQERIFDPYVQIGNRERDRSKGLGLGLAIVRQATQLLGMPLRLLSRPQRGSCFRLHIPAAQVLHSDLLGTSKDALPEQPSTAVLAGRRILLIDDDRMVQQAMQALLGSWQIDLRCAGVGDPEVVLKTCQHGWAPECIISDFRLPGPLNGIALLDTLLERFPDAVGLLQTGELAQTIQLQAEEAGYLVAFKPVSPEVLAYTLCGVLGSAQKEAACTS